jgi:hypothetical protein
MPNSIRTTSNTTTTANQTPNGVHDDGLSIVQNKHRKVIDLTSPDDDEVILISAFDLRDIACDIDSAATVISDIGKLLGLIHYEKIDTHTAISMARLTHDTTETWANLLQTQLDSINDTLAMTAYAKEVEK